MRMRPIMSFFLLALLIAASACAPVLRHDLMEAGIRNVSLSDVQRNPDPYQGSLFILGGIIVDTKATPEGSLIEALHVPVDSRGYLEGIGTVQNRFLALFPKESGMLDPLVFKRNREITCAAEFRGLRQGKIDDMEYWYPFFVIKELYLWPERTSYYWPVYYEPYPYWWDYPYWRHGHPYWGWRYHVPPPYWW